ncbi:MAG: DUF4276 family protein [Chloroflexota bacterium]
MASVKLYVEGEGDKTASTRCRKGVRQFLEKVGLTGKMPGIIACGSRNDAYRSFCIALEQNVDELPLLLVDGEARVAPNSEPWHHLHQQDHWPKPQEATNEQVHLMAQCMETWLVADVDTLANYFGQGFNRDKLPGHPDLETAPKADILRGLKEATRHTNKRSYGKGRDSFVLLGQINPDIVKSRCSYARRLIQFLLRTS